MRASTPPGGWPVQAPAYNSPAQQLGAQSRPGGQRDSYGGQRDSYGGQRYGGREAVAPASWPGGHADPGGAAADRTVPQSYRPGELFAPAPATYREYADQLPQHPAGYPAEARAPRHGGGAAVGGTSAPDSYYSSYASAPVPASYPNPAETACQVPATAAYQAPVTAAYQAPAAPDSRQPSAYDRMAEYRAGGQPYQHPADPPNQGHRDPGYRDPGHRDPRHRDPDRWHGGLPATPLPGGSRNYGLYPPPSHPPTNSYLDSRGSLPDYRAADYPGGQVGQPGYAPAEAVGGWDGYGYGGYPGYAQHPGSGGYPGSGAHPGNSG